MSDACETDLKIIALYDFDGMDQIYCLVSLG